ncbi:C45 family peptidase [Fredinandcohnia sp. QZ13]|uniref:C45 family peptidase n=1 Tax=Fredinandcohnia sp. QZ13 TaxID=3073144 RepID=UPI002852FB44|nr:C45 family peptidase [Fredinandcohnia sp. QZ13]MDR4889612.1 C45 family peptidase [Fredinandcohnia sp. QZ13]
MIKKLQLSGTPRQIGEKHGSEGKSEVHQSLETYESLFYGFSKISWKQAIQIALEHLPAIETYNRELIEEMEGVSKGAGVRFEDILVLNTRSEIALAGRKTFSDGCTAIALTPPLTKETIIGQNWDWKSEQTNSLLLLEIEQKNMPTIKMITEGGLIGKIGLNSSGIAVCLNALHTNKKSNQIPIHLGLRSVLNSHTLHEAISKIKHTQMASAANFLIASEDDSGQAMAANYEVSPFGMDMISNNEGMVVHTNHICSPEVQKHLTDMNEYKFEDSMIRKNRAEQLIFSCMRSGTEMNENRFKEWFSDTFNYPNSINHYVNPSAPEHRQMETVFSVIMNLSKRTMQVCIGKPSLDGYIEV